MGCICTRGTLLLFGSLGHGEHKRKAGRIDRRRSEAKESEEEAPEKSKAGGRAWADRKAQAAAERKARKIVADYEKRISVAELRKEQLEDEIAEAFGQGANDRGVELSGELDRLSGELRGLYHSWLAAGDDMPGRFDGTVAGARGGRVSVSVCYIDTCKNKLGLVLLLGL